MPPAMFQNILLDILKRWLGTPQAPSEDAPLSANMPAAWLSLKHSLKNSPYRNQKYPANDIGTLPKTLLFRIVYSTTPLFLFQKLNYFLRQKQARDFFSG